MALRFIDSFDHYVVGSILSKYEAGGDNTLSTAFSSGRFGGSAMRVTSPIQGVIKVMDSQATWVAGAAFNFSTFTSGSPGNDTIQLFRFEDGGTPQIGLRLANRAGNLFIQHGSGSTMASSTDVPISLGTWYFIEFKVTIHNSTGVAEVRINGDVHPELTLSGVDTQNSGNATADRLRLAGVNTFFTSTDYKMDDLYVLDGTGSSPSNTYLGDVRIEMLLPDGNGNSSQFLGSDANSTDNYLLVDDATPDSDTTYVESDTVSEKDTYTYADMDTSAGTVYGIQVVPMAKKTDASSRKFKPVTRLSGTEVDGTERTLTTSYLYFPEVQEAKPGGGAWSITDVNNAEFGEKITT